MKLPFVQYSLIFNIRLYMIWHLLSQTQNILQCISLSQTVPQVKRLLVWQIFCKFLVDLKIFFHISSIFELHQQHRKRAAQYVLVQIPNFELRSNISREVSKMFNYRRTEVADIPIYNLSKNMFLFSYLCIYLDLCASKTIP